ncbi:unnamed protein product [Rhizophagus irregularis]|uniref:Uncharacterized protein n=1 Tax=Rhizophagus irregularis TaxID=588596 RepID=A0A916E1V1_9GLOM|nr:unnamed protein product [Rhizophagus irregularis]CAB5352093.1 unnamed protein product [Rhizophagus irregularis]CAB5391674.1 unnamed protein product [Rhizophagus irregularis]
MEMFDFYDLNDQISVFSDTDSGFKESYDNEEYENNQYEDDFVIDFDEEGYFRALNSLINETDESDIEPDDTESELSEISEPDEDFYQVIGQDTDNCYALKESGNFCKSSLKNFSRPRFSCGNCFVDKGGHLYTKPGKGKKKKVGCEEHHVADTSTQLEIIGRWFIRIAKFGEDKFKNKTLAAIAPSIFQILQEIRPTKHTSEPTISESVSEEIPDVPSLFMLHVGMQLKQINIEVITQEDLKDQFCQDLGKQFALKIWKSRIELTLNKNQLQNPQSIGEYVSSFPSWLP